MSKFEIKRIDRICGTPIIALVVKAWAELEDSGFGLSGSPYTHEGNAYYIEQDGKPVAFIHWSVTDWCQEMWINLGYVLPEYRKQGMYNALYAELLAEARRLKLRTIGGCTDFNNQVMRDIAIRQGRKARSITYSTVLEYDEPETQTDEKPAS